MLIVSLGISVLLHLSGLSLSPANRAPRSDGVAPLMARLQPLREPTAYAGLNAGQQDPALARRRLQSVRQGTAAAAIFASTVNTDADPQATPALPAPVDAFPSDRPSLAADARRQARQLGREAMPGEPGTRSGPDHPVARAIARATQEDEPIERRGQNGELVVETRRWRCVTPLQGPHYMSGMTVPTQCASRKE